MKDESIGNKYGWFLNTLLDSDIDNEGEISETEDPFAYSK
jgi:hypothetical protein